MRNVKQTVCFGVLALTLSITYGCENRTAQSKPEPIIAQAVPRHEKSTNNAVKIALLLDTSNSMDGLINQAKAQLWDMVNQFTRVKCGNQERPNLQIAIYQYGNDRLSSQEGYIQQILGFSSDLDEISEKLFSLTTYGGEEYCGEVINTSLNQLEWGKNPDHLKMIFIAGNEPFSQGKINYKDAVTKAKENGVIVNTIFCGGYEEGVTTDWKNGALLTGGEYMAIDHNRQVVQIETPYDDIIIKLNSKLNSTYISYGSLGASKMEMQSTQDSNAHEMEEVVAVKRAVSKSSHLYNNAAWDLVDATADKDFDLSKLQKDQLPEALQNKSTNEIKAHIELKKAERIKIQKEIQELNSQREAFIAKNETKGTTGELENAMLSAIKKQGASKNYTWD